ncbi:MAG TPA: ribonuclease Y [Dehalococcoidia bacterium]|nr:ribonuclease Y [Dehalococcoidia bacterium]
MDTAAVSALAGAGALVLGAVIGYLAVRVLANELVQRAEREGEALIGEAQAKRREVELQGQEEALAYRQQVDEDLRGQRREIGRSERRTEQREEALERRAENMERAEQSLRDRQGQLDDVSHDLDEEREGLRTELERIAGMSIDDARTSLLDELDSELRDERARRIRAMEASASAESDTRARKVLATVMQRMTSEITAETTVSVVPIPSDEIKGRIIGREGRNIRAFEAATGCDLIIDDTPEVVTVSGFDPVRREIARTALARLIQDGRIQPTRIEEAVDRARKEIDENIARAGEEAMVDAEVAGLHPEIVKTLGRLRYRFSYGQNQLRHCLETSWLAAALAHEIGADVEIARVGGLLHDLGKAVDRELEGTHAAIGAELAGRFQVPREVVHCIAAHHEEVRPETTEALIVIIADAMSGSRPGARRESSEQYIKRLEALESIANSFDGVDSSFAIQAGREVRIIVQPEQVDDADAMRLARDVSRKIEETMQYPGEIKVTVVRETRASAVAH